jgi:hypothetical protein
MGLHLEGYLGHQLVVQVGQQVVALDPQTQAVLGRATFGVTHHLGAETLLALLMM